MQSVPRSHPYLLTGLCDARRRLCNLFSAFVPVERVTESLCSSSIISRIAFPKSPSHVCASCGVVDTATRDEPVDASLRVTRIVVGRTIGASDIATLCCISNVATRRQNRGVTVILTVLRRPHGLFHLQNPLTQFYALLLFVRDAALQHVDVTL